MSTPSFLERLAALPTLADIPRDQLQWLLDHGEVRRGEGGEEFRAEDEEHLGLYVLVSGRFSVRVDRDGVTREVREVLPGGLTGHLPYSRLVQARGYLVADGPIECVFINKADFREMTRQCYELTAACVHYMLDRVRDFKDDDKHQEKMAALGRLSAGLAHELNNPTSAVARGAGELDARRSELVAASVALGAAGLDADARRTLHALEEASGGSRAVRLSPLDRADLEDRTAEWLDGRGIDEALAYPLVARGVTIDDLEAAASALDGERLAAIVRYVAADAAARALTSDIASAADRIHSLVAAVKKHTHMDRAPATEPILIQSHIDDTVALMRSKAELKGISLKVAVDPRLPPVVGSVADLNQVWMHLVDNAIDAAPESGHIRIEARRDADTVVVHVVDDGPGIPPEHHEQVFEPFFTTKDVGQGRGLGLDIVRTVVRGHRGAVRLRSEPGCTEFLITLPAAPS